MKDEKNNTIVRTLIPCNTTKTSYNLTPIAKLLVFCYSKHNQENL